MTTFDTVLAFSLQLRVITIDKVLLRVQLLPFPIFLREGELKTRLQHVPEHVPTKNSMLFLESRIVRFC